MGSGVSWMPLGRYEATGVEPMAAGAGGVLVWCVSSSSSPSSSPSPSLAPSWRSWGCGSLTWAASEMERLRALWASRWKGCVWRMRVLGSSWRGK